MESPLESPPSCETKATSPNPGVLLVPLAVGADRNPVFHQGPGFGLLSRFQLILFLHRCKEPNPSPRTGFTSCFSFIVNVRVVFLFNSFLS